jgi:thiaminase/transcriptional activator TenA
VNDLLAAHADEWAEAVSHPFLDDVREGTLADGAFDRWLAQDHLFVAALVRAQAGILAAAPRADMGVLAGGLVALVDELDWFEQVAERRDAVLDAVPLPAARDYVAFLMGLPTQPYVVAAVALWAVERAYLEAWRSAAPGAPPFRELVEHWTVPEFAAYVDGLQANADRAWDSAIAADRGAAEAALLTVARHETAFWQMAFAD